MKCSRTLYFRSATPDSASFTTSDSSPLAPDAATQLGPTPKTCELCRLNHSGCSGTVFTATVGDEPPTLGYSSHSVPSSALRSPGAPKLRPSRRTGPFAGCEPKKVQVSTSAIGTSAIDV